MKRRVAIGAAFFAGALAAAASARATPPPLTPSEPIPSPGRALASDDDTTAIAVNPADLAFLPAPEFRWTWVWQPESSPMVARGHAFSFGLPLWIFATGLRLDLMDPPAGAPGPYDQPYQWLRWAIALRGGDTSALGVTFGWSHADAPALDNYFSVTAGWTFRPSPYFALAAAVDDFNEPTGKNGIKKLPRTYEAGLAVRPWRGRRDIEIGVEAAYQNDSRWVPRATVGVDVPHVGRLRADLAGHDLDDQQLGFSASVGLDLNMGLSQLSGGALFGFGDASRRDRTGFYAGLAVRGFREPGMRLPSRVVKIKIDSVPGTRRHTHLLQRLWRIADDPEIEGVVFVIHAEPAGSYAHAQEVAEAVRLLRVRGKKVLCDLEDAGGKSLYVCSQADRIALNPAGGLRFAGLSSEYWYFGGLLKKLGVRADFVRIGEHKLAAEEFANDAGTEVARADHQDLVNQFEMAFMNDVAGGRHVSVPELRARIARGPFVASEAKAAGLVDVLAYEDEIDRVVEEMMGRSVNVVDYTPIDRAPSRWGNRSKVAVIYLAGDMIDGESQFIPLLDIRLAGSRTITKALRRAREDPSIKAVVFRIETGGGSSLAADVILREAILTARVKPLIVSMGSHAASGGYYVSVAGKEIFAEPSTVTGSIGIFYGKADLSGLLHKVGVNIESFRSAPRADAESLFRPFTDDERRELGVKVKEFYDTFIARVAEGRHMTPQAVDAIARGRVWTGAQAKDRGLVDRLGGLRGALMRARELADLPPDAPIVELPEEDDSILGFLLNLAGVSASQQASAGAFIPAPMLDIARALAPFFVYDAKTPLAHVELVSDLSLGSSTPRETDREPAGSP